MSTIDLAPNGTDGDTWRAAVKTACSDSNGGRVAVAGCAAPDCTVWFVSAGPEDAARVQAQREGWALTDNHGEVYCPQHARGTA